MEDGETYSVQKAVLCNASEYFDKALNGPFREALEGVLKLPDCYGYIFENFIYWLFQKDLSHLLLSDFPHIRLVTLWCFGETYLLPKFQNCVMRTLITSFKDCYVDPEAVELAMSASQVNSPLWRAMVKRAASDYSDPGMPTDQKLKLESNTELLVAVARQLASEHSIGGVDDSEADNYLVPET
jgi:hypothetical protein